VNTGDSIYDQWWSRQDNAASSLLELRKKKGAAISSPSPRLEIGEGSLFLFKQGGLLRGEGNWGEGREEVSSKRKYRMMGKKLTPARPDSLGDSRKVEKRGG